MGFLLFALALLVFFGSTRDLVPGPVARFAIPAGLAAGVFTLLRFSVVARAAGGRRHRPTAPGPPEGPER